MDDLRPHDAPPSAPRHETSDIVVRGIVWTSIALLLGVVIAFTASWLLLSRIYDGARQETIAPRSLPAEPMLEGISPRDVSPFSRRFSGQRRPIPNADTAERYGWVEEAHTTARIPVTKAIDLVLEELQSSEDMPAFPRGRHYSDSNSGREPMEHLP